MADKIRLTDADVGTTLQWALLQAGVLKILHLVKLTTR